MNPASSGCVAVLAAEQELSLQLEATISLLEAQIPASQSRNEKLEKDTQKDVARYFEDLEKAFPYQALGGLLNG